MDSEFAMSFLKKAQNAVSGLVKSLAPEGTKPYEVKEISSSTLHNLQKCQLACHDDCMSLYREGAVYLAVIVNPASPSKAYNLFRVQSETEAMTTFSNMSAKLVPLVSTGAASIVKKEVLQQFSDHLREHPTYSCAHLAARLGLKESFRHPVVLEHLNEVDEVTGRSPIMVAIEVGRVDVIQELIICGVKLNLADNQGDNVFHYAARLADPTPIQLLGGKDKSVCNQLNLAGESALHTACLSDQAQNVEHLLRWGADPGLTRSFRYPIHCAMKVDSQSCVVSLCRWSRDQINLKDSKYGGSPLHWAKSRELIYVLADLRCNLDAVNHAGETALHIMIERRRIPCVMALLAKGANAAVAASHGNNALHIAIQTDDVDLVKSLIVFGGDINYMNSSGLTPRHIAALSPRENSQKIIYLLHEVGARRCPKNVAGCKPGCSAKGTFDGLPTGATLATPEHQKKLIEGMVADVAMTAAMTRSTSATGSAILSDTSSQASVASRGAGDRLLSLDGGGIRGLVLIQILLAIEKAAGKPIRELFDWIAGTSTGGILALAIVHAKPMRYVQGLYFQLKDTVFEGNRPYKSEPLESFMKREFGENVRMTEKPYPRVLVTGVLGDRNPTELHFFRNFDPPGEDHQQIYKTGGKFEPPARPNEQFVWQAARSSGAAPTYFRAFGRFLDGGLMSNNPTLDLMTEVHEYNVGLSSQGRGSDVRPLHVVVSLGTGRKPVEPVAFNDVFRPEGLSDLIHVVHGAKNLGLMMVEAATQSEGRMVSRARAWCSSIQVPYFRFSPQLAEEVQLDCKDDRKLTHMLWQTQRYINQNWDKFEQLAMLLK